MFNKKSTKVEAHYQGEPKDGQHCSQCDMFRAPMSCTSVKGLVSRDGWCKYFKNLRYTPKAQGQQRWKTIKY